MKEKSEIVKEKLKEIKERLKVIAINIIVGFMYICLYFYPITDKRNGSTGSERSACLQK